MQILHDKKILLMKYFNEGTLEISSLHVLVVIWIKDVSAGKGGQWAVITY